MSFAGLIGHAGVVRAFEHAWRKGRLAHAYLLVGPEGIGKRTLATAFAAALLCEARRERLEPCGGCRGCVEFRAGTHADFASFAPPENSIEFPIAVIREVGAALSLKPMRGGRKIALLDRADELNDAAANAFLKTLEEPPPGSMLLLIGGPTAETQLSTIVSRCQVIRLAPLADDELRLWLSREGVTEPQRVQRLMRLAGGSPGRARELDDDTLWQFRQEMLAAFADPRRDSVADAKRWMEAIESAGKESASHRRRAAILVRFLIELLQRATHLSLGREAELDRDETPLLQAMATQHGAERLMGWIERCLRAEEQIDRRVQLELLIEGLHDSLRAPPASPPSAR